MSDLPISQLSDIGSVSDNDIFYIVALGSPNVSYKVTGAQVSAYILGKVPAAPVTSVNGHTGTVVLTTADIADSTNARYVTDAELVNILTIPNLVLKTTTVNGHALSGNVTVTAADVGLGNVSNNLQLNASQLTTDGTLSADSDSLVPSEKAVKTYVDSKPPGGVSSVNTKTGTVVLVPSDIGAQPTGNYITALTGDVTAAGPGSAGATLASVVTAGSVGSASLVPVITYDAKGRITGVTTAANPQGTITAITGDLSASGTGSVTGTLATVNTNTGSFGSSTAIPNFTVNGKGQITAAGTNAVVAPAGTLTGSTLAAGVTASSLTSVGTLANLTVTNAISGSVTGNAGTVTTINGHIANGTNTTVSGSGTVASPYQINSAGGGVTTIDGISGAVTLVGNNSITVSDNSPTAGSISLSGVFFKDANNNIWSSNTTDAAPTQSNNFFSGLNAGLGATNASNSNFFGTQAGNNATNAIYSNFFGENAGYHATYASYSNFFSTQAGFNATYASGSNFFGYRAGYQATNASSSNFFGDSAGLGAANTSGSNFFGSSAGFRATSAYESNFFGFSAGYAAANASYSNFFGFQAGHSTINASYSNFFGIQAGYQATNAGSSNFFGFHAGQSATYASASNFFGDNAGQSATYARYSNFFGFQAGQSATNAKDAIFIGTRSGYNDTVNNTSSGTSIAIGRFSGTGGHSDSIAIGHGVINSTTNEANIGNVIYIDGIYASDTQSAAAITSGKLGVGVQSPAYTVDAFGDINAGGVFRKAGTAGISGTMTTSSLVGKTLTFSGGIIVGFA